MSTPHTSTNPNHHSNLPVYAPTNGIRARCGQVLYAALTLVVFSPLFLSRLLQRTATRASSSEDEAARRREQLLVSALRTPWVAAYVRRASSTLWWLHDVVLSPVFGCGVSTAVPYELAPARQGGRQGSL